MASMMTGVGAGAPKAKVRLLAGVALIAAGVLPAQALAGSYTAGDPTQLAAAINAANADGDASATITLTGGFTATSVPTPSKPITIDTGSFTLTGVSMSGAGNVMTFAGKLAGADASPSANAAGQVGILLNTNSQAVNTGTITGGAGGGLGGVGGNGATVQNHSSLTNSGTITGGGSSAGVVAGTGVVVSSGSSLTNNGLIVGGSGATTAGAGVGIGSPTGGAQTLINNGTIRGGTSVNGVGGVGLSVKVNTQPIVNTGTIEGGAGAAAITSSVASFVLTNTGTIAAGAGQTDAIQFAAGTSALLELQAGSVIKGNVVGLTSATNTLRLGGATDATFDASAIGDGAQYRNFSLFEKTGVSTWTLTGATTAVTPWQIQAGVLKVSSDAGLGAASGALTFNGGSLETTADMTMARNIVLSANGTVIVDPASTLTLGGAISGAGGLTKAGTGTLVLTSDQTWSGGVTVSAGALRVNGSLAQSAVTVQSGARLGGNGTVGATAIQGGGVIAPGNSIGVLHVNGALTQAAGSTYEAELDPNTGASDQIVTSGATTLTTGVNLNAIKSGVGPYRAGTVYTVLTANGGLTGTYALSGDTADVSAFLTLKDSYDANHAYLTVVQTRSPADAAQTGNQQQTAAGAPGAGTGLGDALLNLPSDAAARGALDQLSGEGHAAARGVLVADSRLVRDLTTDRVRGALCASGTADRSSDGEAGCRADHAGALAWGQAFGAWGRSNSTADAGGDHRSTGGFLIGADLPVTPAGRVGVFAGYSRTDVSVDGGSADIGNYHAGAYGGWQQGPLGLRAGAAFTYHAVDADRQVAFAGFQDRLKSAYGAHTTQGYAEAAYLLPAPITVEAFANIAYASVHSQGFAETGGAAALTAAPRDTGVTYTTLGLRPSVGVQLGGLNLSLRGMAGWRYGFGDLTPTSQVAFGGGRDFIVQGVALARSSAVAELGADMRLSDRMSFGLTYAGQYASSEADQSVKAELRVRF